MLSVNNISFTYTEKPFLENISFKVEKGGHLAIIGESGSGKSTLLNIIYGKHDILNGNIFWKETNILGPAHNLVVGYDFMKYVSQEYDLMPFITVEENVGKYLSNFYPKKKNERTQELLRTVELEAFSKTKVKDLSGGQKQRVALARALAKEPEILLLDEPFSDIDNFKKQSLRRKLFKHLKQNNISCITATHDKDDIISFADCMIVLNKGKVIAEDRPENLYKNPKTKLIASFFGEFNILKHSDIDSIVTHQEEILVYAIELKVVENSDFRVEVIHSYFNGNNYLISSTYKNQEVLFYNSKPIEKGKFVCLNYTGIQQLK